MKPVIIGEQEKPFANSDSEETLRQSAYACAIAKHRLREHNEVNYESDAAGAYQHVATDVVMVEHG